MKKNKQLNNKDLNGVSGGNNLEKYLKSLAGKDKNKLLVDYGTGVKLDLDNTIDYEKSDNLIILKREKDKQEE